MGDSDVFRQENLARLERMVGEPTAVGVPAVADSGVPFRVEIAGASTPDEYNAAQVQRAYEKGWDLRPTMANASRLDLQPVLSAGAQRYEDVPSYDAFSGAPTGGTERLLVGGEPMGYGQQMRNVGRFYGEIGSGARKGFVNLVPETAAFAYRMTGYAIAGVTAYFDTDVSDRMFAQYERVTGRILDYDNGLQELGGVAAQLAAPTIFKGFSAGGPALYEFEQSAKYAINDKYRHLLPGSSSILEADTTFYAYKNSKYLQAEYGPLQLWMTPDLMTGREAVQKLATPFASGYDTLLTVSLPAGTRVVTPRPVWSMFGRPGGGTELRAYSPVTQDMWILNKPPK